MKKEKIDRVCITYPPFEYNKGFPLMSLNRQFQWVRNFSCNYPILPAYAATLLKNNGYDVFFIDTVARKMDIIDWLIQIDKINPQLIFFEATTATINYTWDTIDAIKDKYKNAYIVLAGDHVTALPEESFDKSEVDFVITGGDYDILLLSIVNHINNGEKLKEGIYYRTSQGNIRNTGKCKLDYPLDRLPFIDRNLTNWKLYSKENEYYKKTPATFIMSGRGAVFSNYNCAASNILFNNVRLRNPINVVDEIEYLYKRYGIKEFVDVTVSFPMGEWLSLFCQTMIERKLNKKVYIDCHMYFTDLDYHYYKMMKKAGFKTLIVTFPSANTKTLEKLFPSYTSIDSVIKSIKMARKAGLFIDMMVNIGYPWENEDDIIATYDVIKYLMTSGYINTMNTSIFVPYPGTNIFNYCKENNYINTDNWFEYDMRSSVLKLEVDDIFQYVEYFYNLSFNPMYVLHKILSIRDIYDIKHHINSFRNVVSSYINRE
ncbi:Fe-S-oxidoreductase [Brachyspira pilosicoli B2904]|uniref:Fe-S-oxidoreductase n=1 Tax=Brachyspira pilosicoli B2904 TaxID=1133568 RepID=J9ULU5_BRAPL|nr:radical SAM protein [Brachyspira pilosicoli]AFR71841.1 Fe-S-oxidoreductase [Brachyspira pilosicoli B2904]